MIRRLVATDYPELYRLQQRAYRVEADLIGATSLPPLLQTEAELFQEQPIGYVMHFDERLVGALTIEQETITRLVVAPEHFRQGIAKQLLRHTLTKHRLHFVSTAADNLPAIALYHQFGFRQIDQVSLDAIVLVKLQRG
ncbi:GNAT family N-acetyltransferase [Exiguobacterium sp. 17-1]|uniref:GNAT family N-acetyltransferase n=1 Tax=Exiguobacterium sp. 17-1 TaxID=2931981 RepID=UPI001FFE7EA7|nr:GNAT family N-acetyltransferase [Exiguobacterium sp. 17-1]MCK2156319.1 GNAT family N-acetyltransferase [Exiguobacterium sp. 17-1]